MAEDQPPRKKVTNIRDWKRKSWRKPTSKPSKQQTRDAKPTDKPEPRLRPRLGPPGNPPPKPSGFDRAAERAARALASVTKLKQRPGIRWAMLALPRWITPNIVTYFRAGIIWPAIVMVLTQQWWPALLVFLFSMSLDFVDGALAEARGESSEWGKFLDPAADKVAVYLMLGALTLTVQDSLIGIVLVVSVIIGGLSTLLRAFKMFWNAHRDGGDAGIAANVAGKLKLIVETVAVSLCLVGSAVGSAGTITAGLWLMVLATGLAAMSLMGQVKAFLEQPPRRPPGDDVA